MLSNFLKWFEKSDENKPGDIAKRRLQLVLVNNRAGLDPELMERIKNDVVRVLSKYIELDMDTTNFNWESSEESVALVSNIEVKRIRGKSDESQSVLKDQ